MKIRVKVGSMTRAADVSFVGALAYKFPELLPLLQEHVDSYEMLPHLFR